MNSNKCDRQGRMKQQIEKKSKNPMDSIEIYMDKYIMMEKAMNNNNRNHTENHVIMNFTTKFNTDKCISMPSNADEAQTINIEMRVHAFMCEMYYMRTQTHKHIYTLV